MDKVTEIVTIAAGSYEFLSRVIPTKKNWSIVHKVFQALTFLSSFLNRTKKEK